MAQFTFKPFNEMTDADYAEIGFKSGLEIHQQLLTAKKLFCRCPAGCYSDRYDAEILRHMRPTLSELGEYDGTALMEFKTKKEIIYQIQHDTVCTYEMDDTPPFELNDDALDIALEIALLYGCTMVDEIHIARKQYLDGSIPTGFQRTTIAGVDGSIPYKDRKIGIIQLGLEEDACREVSDIGHRRVYITDRLGMPLIESVTAPDMRTPTEVAEVGELLRRLVRSTGHVRTGIGAGRQDVNVSVTGGTRIEIKGVPRIPNIPLLTYNEAMRQYNLLQLRDELHKRGITPETFSAGVDDVTRVLRKTRFKPIHDALADGQTIRCVMLRGFQGLLRWKTQTDTYFSREISDRVRVIACLTTLPNIIHSDSMGETIAASEWQAVRKAVGARDQDTVVLVWGRMDDAVSGAAEIIIRAREATIGIPSETRQALRDGTNGFERILPGPDRMYPDTDLPPKRITSELLDRIRAHLPEFIWDRERWYRDLGLPSDVIKCLAISPFAELFRQLISENHVAPMVAAETMTRLLKKLNRQLKRIVPISAYCLQSILIAHSNGILTRDGIFPALHHAATTGSWSPDALPAPCSIEELQAFIHTIIVRADNKCGLDDSERLKRWCIGEVMRLVRGRIPGRIVADAVMNQVRNRRQS